MKQMVHKAPIAGIVRYSQIIEFNNGEKQKNIFEREYFEYRFEIFKEITLKAFQNQINSDFLLLIIHSESMPDEYKSKFNELEQSNPFLLNFYLNDSQTGYQEFLRNTINYISFKEGVGITFRIDNDDAVSSDFIEILSGYLKNHFSSYSICFPYIYKVKQIPDASFMIEESYYPSNSIGLAYVTKQDNYKTVMDLGVHDGINRKVPIILHNHGRGLMTINGENAANGMNDTRAKVFTNTEIQGFLTRNKFAPFNLKVLRAGSGSRGTRASVKNALLSFVPPVIISMGRRIKAILVKRR